MSHAKNPWQIFDNKMWSTEGYVSILAADGLPIIDAAEIEDARRIVACVNACEGVPTEKLESGGVGSCLQVMREQEAEIERLKLTPPDKREDLRCVISDLCAQVREAERQRDELLAALVRVQNFPSHPGSHKDDRSGEADCPESWRHGWICAVEAIQDHAIPNSSAIDAAIAAARKEQK